MIIKYEIEYLQYKGVLQGIGMNIKSYLESNSIGYLALLSDT